MKSTTWIVVAGLVTGAYSHDGEHSGSLDPNQPTGFTITTLDSSVTSPADSATQVGCPTVTETASICSTCAIPECLRLVTLIQKCGCPLPIATETVTYDCNTACEDMGIQCAGTSYSIITPECSASTTATEGDETVSDLETMPTFINDTETTDANTETVDTTGTTEDTTSTATTVANEGEVTVNAAAGRFRPFLAW